jgi:hypothetical protein
MPGEFACSVVLCIRAPACMTRSVYIMPYLKGRGSVYHSRAHGKSPPRVDSPQDSLAEPCQQVWPVIIVHHPFPVDRCTHHRWPGDLSNREI